MPKDKIADDRDDEQILKGVQPRHQICYKVFKCARLLAIFGFIIATLLFILTFIPTFDLLTANKPYRYFILILVGFSALCVGVAAIDRALFLRKAPFDDWVFEIAEKRLGTSIIFYDSKRIYIQYDRGGKEVDKREFVSEMSDKSEHFSYFYRSTDIDKGFIAVECKKRQPIPDRASFSPSDDKFWNTVPLGLTIISAKQSVGVIHWYLNDQNIDEDAYPSVPSTSILICG